MELMKEIIKFEPKLVQTIWGGEKIIPFKKVDTKLDKVGESWEISGVPGHETLVKEGPWKGKTVNELVTEFKEKLVGEANYKRFGDEFPLLIKFIDACQDLSIQVHPNDELARKHGLTRGKTEMWYVMDSTPDAMLYSGLKEPLNKDSFHSRVADNTICDVLAQHKVKQGDVFFLPAGRIHAIGAGCFLAEIQQTSNVTYRIYDYGRKDKDGKLRDLHVKEAAECIDYKVYDKYNTHYVLHENQGVSLVRCPHFTTTIYEVNGLLTLDYADLDSFVVLICVEGEGQIIDYMGVEHTFSLGETLLLPAGVQQIQVKGKLRFLETYV